MRRTLATAALLAALAACGADGPPQPPPAAAKPGVAVSGEARIGVILGP